VDPALLDPYPVDLSFGLLAPFQLAGSLYSLGVVEAAQFLADSC
jgi:hypothetical protein